MKKYAFVAALLGLGIISARATDCPPGVKACRVLTLTPDEELVLVQPNGILDTAERARFLDLSQATRYFREKIATSPAGDVKVSPPPAEPAKP